MQNNIIPTKNNLINTKKSLSLAVVGRDLMERKRKILVSEMMRMMNDADKVYKELNEIYKDAYSALQKANVTLGLCSEEAQSVPIDDTLSIREKSVMGTILAEITLTERENGIYYGLESTNSKLDDAMIKFNEAKKLTTRLAEINNNVIKLADAVKKSQKRTNALGNIVIPRQKEIIKNISGILEEKEREEFSRTKQLKINNN